MRSTVVTIPCENWTVEYKRFAARIPDFLNDFSPTQYGMEIVTTDILSIQPGLLELLKALIAAGIRPGDVGLSLDRIANTFVSKATLYGPNNTIVRTASARAEILEYKDHESLETAAYQRMLASLGHGGEIFNEDENRDLARQNLTATVNRQSQMSSDVRGTEALPVDLTDGTESDDEQNTGSKVLDLNSTDPPVIRDKSADLQKQEGPAARVNTPRQPGLTASPAPFLEQPATKAMRRQIISLAKRVGVEPHDVDSQADAIAEMQRLVEFEGQTKRTGAP